MPFKSAIAEIADNPLVADLRRFIEAARDWQALGEVVDAAEAAYQQRKLDAADVEELAILAIEVSRRIPEQAEVIEREENSVVIWAEDLVSPKSAGATHPGEARGEARRQSGARCERLHK